MPGINEKLNVVRSNEGFVRDYCAHPQCAKHCLLRHVKRKLLRKFESQVWKGDRLLICNDSVVHPAERIDTAKPPLQYDVTLSESRKMRREDIHNYFLPWSAATNRRRIDRENVAGVNHFRVVAEILWCAVVVQEAVAFPFNVVQLSVDVG